MYLIMVKLNLILFNPLESEIHLNYIEEGQLETECKRTASLSLTFLHIIYITYNMLE
jgi:hypothetical protein